MEILVPPQVRNGSGGIAGYFRGDILCCFNKCEVQGNKFVGGIAGGINGIIENCYNTKNVSGENRVGGILGATESGMGEKSVINCYSLGDVIGSGYVGPIVGILEEKQGDATVNCYTKDDTFSAEDLGAAFKEDTENKNNGYPLLYWETEEESYFE